MPRQKIRQPDPVAGEASAPVVRAQVADPGLVQLRQEQIASAAAELFSSQGFYRTTIQQVARRVGVSIGLIYQYAETKEDVLLLALLHVMTQFRREIEQAEEVEGPLERLFVALDTYCRVVDRNREAAMLAYRSTMSLPLEHRKHIKQAELVTNELIARRIRDCADAGLFRTVDIELATYQLVLHAHAWSLKRWRLTRITTIEAYTLHGFDMFVQALATAKGRQHYERFLAMKKTGKPVPRPGRRGTETARVA